jgi:hypothetical protein
MRGGIWLINNRIINKNLNCFTKKLILYHNNVCFCYRFNESAASYIRITNETKDLRSALLLEQAAYCYLVKHILNNITS